MATMLPFWRNTDVSRLMATNGLILTDRWMRAILERPSVLQTSAGKKEMVAASRKYFVNYVSPGAPGTL